MNRSKIKTQNEKRKIKTIESMQEFVNLRSQLDHFAVHVFVGGPFLAIHFPQLVLEVCL